MGDRLKPAEYGQKVAKSVLAQIGPEWNAIKAKAHELEAVKKRVPQLESATRQAQKQAKAAQERAAHLADLAELFSPAEIAAARSRKAERDKAEAAQKQLAERAAQKQQRIDALPGLRAKTAGAAHTFVNRALAAIERAGGDPTRWSGPRWKVKRHARRSVKTDKAPVCDTGHLRAVAGAGQQGQPCEGGRVGEVGRTKVPAAVQGRAEQLKRA